MKDLEEIRFKCIPVTQRYYSEDSNYGVFVFHTKDDIPKYDAVPQDPFGGYVDENLKMSILAGNMQQLYIGSEYEVTATLDYNNKYKNYQYKPKSVVSVAPKTEEQQKMFLESIVTKRQAETLIEKYPNIVQDIIDGTDNVDLANLKGIGEHTYNLIKEKVLSNYVISDILVMLQPLGVTYNKIKKLISNEPNPTLLKEKLTENPYIMLQIKGFGFKTVDQLALKINPQIRVSAKRVYAFIESYLEELGNSSGHTWVNINTLENAVRDNLFDCMDIYKTIIENECKNESVFHIERDMEKNRIGLKRYYEKEESILDILKKLNSYDTLEVSNDDIKAGISKSESDQGFFLTEEQRSVVENSINSNVVIITGKAGSGKTSISRAILNVYKKAGYSISCCALSAMAAQRITEATGFPACTIHRLLGYSPKGFSFNHLDPLPSDVILVDECSMINVGIFHAILDAVQEGKKIIIYLCLPARDKTYFPLASLILRQLSDLIDYAADEKYGGRVPVRWNFVDDELGNFTKITNMRQQTSFGTGKGIRHFMFIQSYAQLDDVYGEKVSQIIQDNADIKIYLRSSNSTTKKKISEDLGNYTTRSYSKSNNTPSGTFRNGGSDGESSNLMGRPLLYPDEVGKLQRPYSLVMSDSDPAIMYAPDLSQYAMNEFLGMGDEEHNNRLRQKKAEEHKKNERPHNSKMELWGIWNVWKRHIDAQILKQQKEKAAKAAKNNKEKQNEEQISET